MTRNIFLCVALLFAAFAIAGCETGAPGRPPLASRPDHRVRVLYVEGTPRWEYRYLKNVLIRKKDEIAAWCLLLSADADFRQEHTPGTYIDDNGVEQRIRPLTTFPTREELARFDVIIWGDVDPAGGAYGVDAAALKSVAQFVMDGGALLCILGENYFPSHYAKGEKGEALGKILPFKIAKEEIAAAPSNPGSASDVSVLREGPQPLTEPFTLWITEDGKVSGLFEFGEGDSEKLWTDEEEGLPGAYWFWHIETDPAKSHGATVFARHVAAKSQDGANYAIFFEKKSGKGVVFVSAIDETWRWRFQYGDEPYFGPFWIRVVNRLAGVRQAEPALARPSDSASGQNQQQTCASIKFYFSPFILLTGLNRKIYFACFNGFLCAVNGREHIDGE